MTHYLIEFRFHGSAKYEIKKLIEEVNRKFELKSKKAVPHITLVGPFSTDNEAKLIRDFDQLCSNNSLVGFEIDGINTFDDNKVVYFDVNPSREMEEFRWNLAQTLKSYCQLSEFDYKRKYEFHSTIAMKLPDDKFVDIKKYVNRKRSMKFKHKMVRATLIKNGLILQEYDFLLRRSLNRELAKNRDIYTHTLNLLDAYFEGRYNPGDYVSKRIEVPPKTILDNIMGLFRKPKVFITSDLHLDHANIIKYCSRPFLNVADMNKTLVANWNNTIDNKDTVYFLGDLAFGSNNRSTDYWLKQLNGNIFFIKGSHDVSDRIKFYDSFTLEYANHNFFLTHRPEDIPFNWNGWSICGHIHNNNVRTYPFIDKENKRINISIELTNYKPVDMDYIIKHIDK